MCAWFAVVHPDQFPARRTAFEQTVEHLLIVRVLVTIPVGLGLAGIDDFACAPAHVIEGVAAVHLVVVAGARQGCTAKQAGGDCDDL